MSYESKNSHNVNIPAFPVGTLLPIFEIYSTTDESLPITNGFRHIMYGFNNSPIGWLECNGDLVSKNDYPELFEIIKYTYGGAGDYFALPNIPIFFIRVDYNL
jgi:hypothetical protein